MSVVEEVTAANERYASGFGKGDLPMPPGRKFAVVTCMDARLDPAGFLGLDEGDAHVIRNAGGLVAADALPHLDEHVFPVGGIRRDEREAQLLLQPARALLELRDELAQVGVVARGREVVPRARPLLRELVRLLELLEATAEVGRLAVVVVDGRIRHPRLKLLVRALEIHDEVVEICRHDWSAYCLPSPFPVR